MKTNHLKPLEESSRPNLQPKKHGDLNIDENIDNEIEILSFLTKRPASHLNAREMRAAQNQISYLQNFEKQLKVFEDNDLINKYADENNSFEEGKFDEGRKGLNSREGNFDSGEGLERNDDYIYSKNQVIEASQEAEEDNEPKQISHKEFASMIDNLKAKALETI